MVNRFFDREDIERLLQSAGGIAYRAPLPGSGISLQTLLEHGDRPRGAAFAAAEELLSGRPQTVLPALRAGARGFRRPEEYEGGDILRRRGMGDKNLPGPLGSRFGLSARDVIGGVADVALDPLNLVPIAKGAKVAGRGARKAAQSDLGRAAARGVREFALEERAAAELPDSFEGAVDALKRSINREMGLRRRGVVQGEIHEGRVEQASNVRRLFEEGQARGLQGEELAAYARSGRAVGPLRRTVAEPMDVTPNQELQLYNRIFERYSTGQILDHEQANATYALNKLVRGEGIMPHERKLLRKAIPELADVIDEGPGAYVPPTARPRRGSSKFLPGEAPDIAAAQVRLPGGGRPRQGSARGFSALQKSIEERLFPEVVEAPKYQPLELAPKAGKAGRGLPTTGAGVPSPGSVLPDAFARPARGAFAAADPFNPTKLELDRLRDVKIREVQADQFPTFSRLVERAREVATKLAPEGKARQVDDIVERWLNGSVAQIERLSEADPALVGAWNKHVLGGTEDSAINAAFYQRNSLNAILKQQGLDPKVAAKVTDDLFQALVSLKWDPQNLGHFPEETQRIFDELKGIPYEQAWGGFDTVVQQMKNTAFGLDGGLSVFGVQGLAALWRGSPALFFGSLNRALGLMHLPGYRELYMGRDLPKAVQAALDGVHQGIGSSAVQAVEEVGSALEWVPLIGKKLDKPLQMALGKSTQFFFGTVLGAVRNAAYEGNLYMLGALGQDIASPIVRKAAADNANAIGSFARSAVRASRSKLESRVLVSPAMRRSQVSHISQMARLVDKGNPQQQILAASTILSTVAMPLLVGKAISDWFGVGEFQWDPSQPGFGQITFDNGRVVDVIPQDSVLSAIAKSADALVGKDPAQIAKVWTQFAVGSATHPVRAAFALGGVGYEPGGGFRMGDLTRSGQILTALPTPPIASGAISGEGLVPGDIALETVGLSSFPESATGLERRVLGNLGHEYDSLTAAQRRDILSKAGYLNAIESKRLEERKKLADRGDRKAEALLIGSDTRQLLDEARKMSTRPNGTLDLAAYRERRTTIMAGHARVSEQFRDVFDGLSESKNPTEKLVGQYWDSVMRGAQNPDGSLDFDKFDQLEAEFARKVGRTNYDIVMSEVHAIDPRDNVAEQRLQDIRQQLDATGYWDIRDDAWAKTRERLQRGGKQVHATFDEYEQEWIEQRAQRLVGRGMDQEVAYRRAKLLFQSSAGKRSFDNINRRNRNAWIKQNRALAQQAIAAGYLSPGRAALRAAV